VTTSDWAALVVVGLSAGLFYITLYAWRSKRRPYWQQGRWWTGWAVWAGYGVILLGAVMGAACAVGLMAALLTDPLLERQGQGPEIRPMRVRALSSALSLSLAQEVVEAAGRAGLPVHLALELAEQESGIRNVVRYERNGSCSVGVMQVNLPDCYTELSDRELLEQGVGMAAGWWHKAGGRVSDWPRAVYAYRHGHLPRRTQ